MDFDSLCTSATRIVRFYAPVDTRNLRDNGINAYYKDANTYVIYVDYYDAQTHNGIAWYMPYTNEPWINRKGKNPNEGWWQDTVQDLVQMIADELGGEIKK